jgi:Skp family chaperone for outer membrane proteins
MKKLYLLSAMLLFGSLAIKAEGDKIGYIKLENIFSLSPNETKSASLEWVDGIQALQVVAQEKVSLHQTMAKEIEKMEKDAKAKSKMVDATAREKQQAEITKKRKSLEELERELFGIQRGDSLKPLQENIFGKLKKISDDIRKTKGLSAIFMMGAISIDEKIDFTEEAVNTLNKAYSEEKAKKETPKKEEPKKPMPASKAV